MHMTLILVTTAFSGFLFSRLLYDFGHRNILTRYLLVLCLSYAVFFLLIRGWYELISPERRKLRKARRMKRMARKSGDPLGGASDVVDVFVQTIQSPSPADSGSVACGPYSGEGGGFSGGGATGTFGDSVPAPSGAAKTAGEAAGSALGGGDEIMIVIVLAAVCLAFVGAGVYIIYEAPLILGDAAFEFALAGALVRGSKKIATEGWVGSVFRTTVVPFLFMLTVTFIAATIIKSHYPNVERISELSYEMQQKRALNPRP